MGYVKELLSLWMISAALSFVSGKHIFCYYSSFTQDRAGIGGFLPEDLDPTLCTHIVYAFVDMEKDGTDIKPYNSNDLGSDGLYNRTLALKKKNPNLKVLLAVGGWGMGSEPFVPMVKQESTRRYWVQNVIRYLRRYGFDGFDMDWEFPGMRGSPPEDKQRFTLLMKNLYEAFEEEAYQTGREKLLLTLATAKGTYTIDQAYEPTEIVNYVDFMLLMTYNYHGDWEQRTGHQSPLYPSQEEDEDSPANQQWSIDFWLNAGISRRKLIVGIPTYAITFTLADPYENGLGAPSVGAGAMGDYTRENGILSYYEVCANLRQNGWRSSWLSDQQVPYAYGGNQWAGYETPESARIKAGNIQRRGLAGAFIWSVEMDDFRGTCGQGRYPILTTIADVLGRREYFRGYSGHDYFNL